MSSNTMVDNLGRGDMEPLEQCISAATVRVEIPVALRGEMLVPSEKSDDVLEAKLRCMMTEDYLKIERECTEVLVDRKNRVEFKIDSVGMRGLVLRRSLLEWNLDFPLEHDESNGWLSDSCWEHVQGLPAPLMAAIVSKYERSFTIGDDEMRVINRQSLVLFGKSSGGVAHPCEAVSLFCNLSGFWKQFGIDRQAMTDLPYLDYMRLRIMISNENEAMTRQMKSQTSSAPKARVSGRGGRSRPSQGIVVPDQYG